MKKLYKCPYSSEKNISFLLLPGKLCIHGTKLNKQQLLIFKINFVPGNEYRLRKYVFFYDISPSNAMSIFTDH
jgi:hypothetical protein